MLGTVVVKDPVDVTNTAAVKLGSVEADYVVSICNGWLYTSKAFKLILFFIFKRL